MRYLFVITFILFAPLSWAETVIVDESCDNKYGAKLVSLQGKFLYDPGRKGQWREARLSQIICEGSGVKVGANSRASLRLASGVVLRLQEGTAATLDAISPDKATYLNLLQGFIHFISRTPRLLKISTPIANAGPEGTEFAMSVDGDKAMLWVYEGGVKLYNDKGSIRLSPGQGGQVTKGQAPQAKIDIKPQDAVSWSLYYPPVLPYPKATDVIDNDLRIAIQDFRQGHTDVALEKLEGISKENQNTYFYKVRAAMRLTVGQDKPALQDIQALLAIKPNDADALALKSVLALTQNRKDEAYTLANNAVTANPQSASAYSALSYAEQSRFQLDKAQAAANKATELAPHDAMVWARKAELQLSQGLTAESQQAAEKAIALDANLERTQTVLGFSYLLRMDTDAALETFNEAIQFDSTSPLARLGLGLAKIRNGDLEQGREDLETAAILDPNNSIVRSYLGKAYYEERRSPLAKDQFKLAKERDPKDPTPYFYDAINKQTTNRPVEALQDMQKAIELNDNRGVYRSSLALDKDKAVRSASLGRIYKNLGFDDVARKQATISLSTDPSNYTAHRLLADSYFYRPRQEIARASEVLQSQLLQPLNYNPIQPQLAYTDLNILKSAGFADTAFNEYSRLFDGNQHRLTTTGLYGSNNTGADETVLSGIRDKFAYSLGQMHYQTDGFRPNADIKHNLYNVFTQYEFSSQLSVQAEYRHRETEHGDIKMIGLADDFEKIHRNLKQETYRFGSKISPTQHSDILFSYIYSDRKEAQLRNPFKSLNIKSKTGLSANQIEGQYIFHPEKFAILLGGGTYITDISSEREINGNSNPTVYSQIDQSFGYIYSHINAIDNLSGTLGLEYDSYNDNDPGGRLNIRQLSPKFGFQWQLNKFLNLRIAAFQLVKATIVNNQVLKPSQIAGFSQFYDDPNGTRSNQYGVGIDARASDAFFGGIEAYFRDLKVLIGDGIFKREEELFRLYLNWLPVDNLILSSEIRFERFNATDSDLLKSLETAYVPLNLRFFSKKGFFVDVGGQFVHQVAQKSNEARSRDLNSEFFLIDAAIGYRLPQQYGMISLEAKNLLDNRFKYRDRSFQMNEERATDLIPERLLFARLTLNF